MPSLPAQAGPLHSLSLFLELSVPSLFFPGEAVQLREQSPHGCRRKLAPELPPLPRTCPQPLPRTSHLSPRPGYRGYKSRKRNVRAGSGRGQRRGLEDRLF